MPVFEAFDFVDEFLQPIDRVFSEEEVRKLISQLDPNVRQQNLRCRAVKTYGFLNHQILQIFFQDVVLNDVLADNGEERFTNVVITDDSVERKFQQPVFLVLGQRTGFVGLGLGIQIVHDRLKVIVIAQ